MTFSFSAASWKLVFFSCSTSAYSSSHCVHAFLKWFYRNSEFLLSELQIHTCNYLKTVAGCSTDIWNLVSSKPNAFSFLWKLLFFLLLHLKATQTIHPFGILCSPPYSTHQCTLESPCGLFMSLIMEIIFLFLLYILGFSSTFFRIGGTCAVLLQRYIVWC